MYQAHVKKCTSQCKAISRQRVTIQPHNVMLPGGDKMPGGLNPDCNEVFLISGTQPKFLVSILTQGLDEKVASMKGMFGAATYLAEDPVKIDQYTAPDYMYQQIEPDLKDLHARLFGPEGHQHPGDGVEGTDRDIFYCMVVRTCLGWYQRTSNGLKNMDGDNNVWHNNDDKRLLNTIPDTDPPMRYHSLIAMAGKGHKLKRFREFMIYDGNQCYIEYVIAYRRMSME